VRVGVVGSPATLDPYSPVASDLTYALVRPVYPSLYSLSPTGRPVPDLARALEPVPEGVRVTLRRMRWSDGRAITSRDVVASLRRARTPYGVERVRRARAVSRHVVVLEGPTGKWGRALATMTFVLPGGIARGRASALIGGGAWRVSRYRPGLKLVYRPNRAAVTRPYLNKVSVFFYESEGGLLDALEDGDVDVAVPPSTINLADRLEEMGVTYDEALGWELVWLDLRQTLSRSERLALVAAINRSTLDASLIRDDGGVSYTLHPGPLGVRGPWRKGTGKRSKIEEAIRLSVPSGDELLFLIQRAIQIQLAQRKIDVDLIIGSAADFYGPWRSASPADVALTRSAGAPGLRDPRRFFTKMTAFPIAHVRTYLAWRPRLNRPQVNPTFDGPLWNMESWWLSKP
jgi:MarR-like DNA-binding transcriptional regulator SgrR of sgrS sRNA